ncbi:hypothetical protein BaRGS_00009694 [Batillaria attramentaria]|uniref:Uncharacterized protein n=1 Tax=Batillaria attramentaria TaxID=370345 RepID=A0ABD0LIK4_9CAEN
MKFVVLGQLLVGLTVLVTGQSTELASAAVPNDVMKCPRLPCPLPPPCPHVLHTYFWYKGKLCLGCDQCFNDTEAAIQKRLLEDWYMCPDVSCAAVECSVPLVPSTLTIDGHTCPGCPVCPDNQLTV